VQEENNHISFTADDIRRYHEGKLTPAQMHALEKASLEDPFLADALEGYAVEEVNVPADIDDLKQRLKNRLDDNDEKVIPMAAPVKPFNWLRVAAMIVAVGGAGLLVYNIGFRSTQNEKTIAQDVPLKKDSPQTATVPTIDSVRSQEKFIAPATAEAPPIINEKASANSSQNDQARRKIAEEAALAKQQKAEQDEAVVELKRNEAGLEMKKISPAVTKPVTGVDNSYRMDTLLQGRVAGLDIQKEEKDQTLRIRGVTNTDKNKSANDGYASQSQTNNALKWEANSNQQQPKDRRQQGMQPSVNVFRGKVTDNQNNPLPFANITNLSDDVGTYADAQGNFVLTSPDSVMNVQVRSLGFENNLTQLQNGLTVNKVALKDDNSIPAIVLSNKKANTRLKQGSMVLEEPEPADGWTKYDAYLANNLKLPDTYRTKPQESGEVELSFEVNNIGEPINIKVEKSLCEVCDKEAIRLLKEGPKWKRKAKKGKRTTITIPF
jgi:hypothetical protein